MKKKYLPLIAIALASTSSCETENMLNENSLKESKGLYVSTIDGEKAFSPNSDEMGMQEDAASIRSIPLESTRVQQHCRMATGMQLQ